MTVGRIGGMLVVAGCAMFVVTGVAGMSGAAVGIGVKDASGLLGSAAAALVGAGAGVLSLTGPRPLNGAAVRVGLGILAVGLLSILASSIIAGAYDSDPLESWPFIISFLVGLAATVIGTLLTDVALVGAGGQSRTAGSVFLAGLALLVGAGFFASPAVVVLSLGPIVRALALAGGVGIVLGGAGVGVLAIRGDSPLPSSIGLLPLR